MNLGNSGSYFAGCQNLNLTATDAPDLNGTTDLAYTFANCSQLGGNGNMNEWNVSGVTDMSGMFQGVPTFNQAIGNWNVSSVTNMSSMFSRTHFHSDISSWDVSNVTDMSYMFYSDVRFNIAINSWNVSSVTDMSRMFYGDYNFNENIDNWDVSHVTDMRYMFYDAWYFNQILADWNVSHVTDMRYMFDEASAFNQPIGNWNVSSVTSMDSMFCDDSAFNQPIGNWNISSVTDMGYMFDGDSAFSTENYGILLIGWSQLKVHTYVQFSAGYTTYPFGAASAHQILSQNDSWDISDGGLANASTPTLYSISSPSFTGNIMLKWSSSINDSSYAIYRSNSTINALTSATLIANVTDTSYNDTNLAAGTYYYVILATNGVTNASISNCESVTVVLKPSEPTNLNTIAETNHISLTWDAPANNGGSANLTYYIYRSDSSNGAFILIRNLTTTSYNDTNITDGQTYYYKISAVNEAGQSTFSNIVNIKAIFVPSQPSNLNATDEANYISLTWNTSADNGGSAIIYYDIYRINSSTGQFSLIWNSTTTSYNDTNVTSGQTYYYEVSAVNSAGASSYSNIVNTTFIATNNSSNNSSKSPNSYLGWIIFGIVVGVVIAGGAVSYVYLQKNPDKRELLSEKLRPLNEKLGPLKEKTNDLIAKSKQKTNDVIKKLNQKIDELSTKRDQTREEPEV